MRIRCSAVGAVLLLALAACGGGEASRAGSGEDLDPASTVQEETGSGGSPEDGSEDRPSTPEPVQEADPPSDDRPASDAEDDPDRPFLLELTLSASCAVPGSTMTADVRTEPEVMIGLSAYYSDTSYTPDIHFVPTHANTTGEHAWSWTLRPDTPLGEATVEVVAGARGRGDTAKEHFEVAPSC